MNIHSSYSGLQPERLSKRNNESYTRARHTNRSIMVAERLFLTTLLAITLFVGGIVLLVSKIPFWSLYFGLPSVQIGIILMILAFEKTSKEKFGNQLDREVAPRDPKNPKSIKASEE